MLIATNYARKMSLDMRLISPHYEDHIDNKASHCAAQISDYYKKYNEYKGTQFVFSDLGTYKPGEWTPYSEIKRKLVEDHNIPAHEVRFIQEAKTEQSRKSMIALAIWPGISACKQYQENYSSTSSALASWLDVTVPKNSL